jgi:hypothetical protein
MWVYWLLFLVPATTALLFACKTSSNPWRTSRSWVWLGMHFVLLLAIGMREKVGADWDVYLTILDITKDITLAELDLISEFAFSLIFWFSSNIWGGIYLFNCICAAFFIYGLKKYTETMPQPWLALVVAMPYMVIMVAMGYTRQSVALGFMMLGLIAIQKERPWQYIFYVFCAVTFHKSAVLLTPLVIFAGWRNKKLWFAGGVILASLFFLIFLEKFVDYFIYGYVEQEYNSSGAGIRLAMNVLPAALFFIFSKRFNLSAASNALWRWMSIFIFAFIPILILSPSSTAVDRVALYFMPIQLLVWSYWPSLVSRSASSRLLHTSFVVLYSACILFVWLVFADNSGEWQPYRFYPWEWLWQ